MVYKTKGQENATIDDEGAELLLCSELGMKPSPFSSRFLWNSRVSEETKKHKLQRGHGGEENRIGVSRGSVAISGRPCLFDDDRGRQLTTGHSGATDCLERDVEYCASTAHM